MCSLLLIRLNGGSGIGSNLFRRGGGGGGGFKKVNFALISSPTVHIGNEQNLLPPPKEGLDGGGCLPDPKTPPPFFE